MLKNLLYLFVLLVLAGLVSMPGYLRAQKNVRRWDTKYQAAELARAKESWAVTNRVALGEPVPGGIPMLIEEEFLAKAPVRPVPGKWILGLVGVPPRFVPDDPAQLEAEGSAIEWGLSDYSSDELKARQAAFEKTGFLPTPADAKPGDEAVSKEQ